MSHLSKPIPCWTDHTFLTLGDAAGEPAPVRAAEIVAYDGDMYVHVEVEGATESVKQEHCYARVAEATRDGKTRVPVSRSKLRRLVRQKKGSDRRSSGTRSSASAAA